VRPILRPASETEPVIITSLNASSCRRFITVHSY
jgi:hypothetical protein